MVEKSLVLIKPDAVERNLIGKIVDAYESNGLKVIAMRLLKVSEGLAEIHYKEHEGKAFYKSLIEYITRSPLCALVLEGENAISEIRRINGATDPKAAEANTIRSLYAIDKTENSVHASDSKESALREISLWFPEVINKLELEHIS
ncbi:MULTISPECIES: nucleoside-diphosphate kinase [Clostridium]|uniref:Nucleoside diphosphate kinase n=1 Tax=Clostridium paridis TaxID=2803863 RepID=A0A937FIH4_9CLOT|nr:MULTISPECIES: nucleoside-diphosphate kinase [Clostridium]MBL4932206.1 nucleoside-diphosphate kinase [Clostridium paridis]